MKYLCIAPKAHRSKIAWGNAPGLLKRQTSAMKARFIADQARRVGESRFQRLDWANQIRGAMPQAEGDTAPLALHKA
jgi:hypothetical protein